MIIKAKTALLAAIKEEIGSGNIYVSPVRKRRNFPQSGKNFRLCSNLRGKNCKN